MRNMLALVGLAVVAGGGIGWYMGWYKVSFNRGSDGTIEIKTDVDPKKVESDSSTFFKNAATVVGNHINNSTQNAQTPAPTNAPGATPGPVAQVQGTAIIPPAPSLLDPPPVPMVPDAPLPMPTAPAPGVFIPQPPK
jgi:hypothetical protein